VSRAEKKGHRSIPDGEKKKGDRKGKVHRLEKKEATCNKDTRGGQQRKKGVPFNVL